jgi:hypothetical protein
MDNESTLTIDQLGNKFWKNRKEKIHRIDGPAVEWIGGGKAWYVNGEPHREDGPATIYENGDKEWWINHIIYETKESYFDALSDEAKAKCLFSEDFLNG